jgi:hypothetical protein
VDRVDCRKRIYERMRSLQLYRLEAGTMVRAELESYLSVLEPFWQQVGRVCADALISSCSRQRLEQFERMLGIPINPNISLERRREIAASRMSIAPSDFNRAGLEKALDAAQKSCCAKTHSGFPASFLPTSCSLLKSLLILLCQSGNLSQFHPVQQLHRTVKHRIFPLLQRKTQQGGIVCHRPQLFSARPVHPFTGKPAQKRKCPTCLLP